MRVFSFFLACSFLCIDLTVGNVGHICARIQVGLACPYTRREFMSLHRHRRFFSLGILLAFLAGCLLPVQACYAVTAAVVHPGCPDCPQPSGAPDTCHCASMAAAHAMLLPATATPARSVAQHASAFVATSHRVAPPAQLRAVTPPPERPPGYPSASALNIRFCTFQN